MSKVVIVGGGIAGMTTGILLQKAGYQTEIFEKNKIVGGQCTGWKREGFFIDNCIHWLTGTKEGSDLYELWKEIGALSDAVMLHEKEMFFSSKLNGDTLTFWKDLDRTRAEMLALSPQDEKEICQLVDHVKLAENMKIPVEKPFDAMNLWDFIKLGMSMKSMRTILKEYGSIDIREFALRFQHPLIRQAIMDYMPSNYQAFAFLVSYATVTSGNGNIPKGGSLEMAMRVRDQYLGEGGVIHTNASVDRILLNGKKAEGIMLQNGNKEFADYVVCACDTNYTFQKLLPSEYMPKQLIKQYEENKKYPVTSGFQIAYAVDGIFPELMGTRFFACEKIEVGSHSVTTMNTNSYEYEPDFAPEGKMVVQTNFMQTEADYHYWKGVYLDQERYNQTKEQIARQALERLTVEYPNLAGKIHVLDIWTPMTYERYCNSYQGSYMGFITTKNAKSLTTPGVIKGIDNLFLASQWLMGPGGLPVAAAMGKFAAWRIIRKGLKRDRRS